MTSVASQLGTRIRDRRNKLGLNQHQLAEISGIQQYQISRIERGDLDPRISTTMKLAAALDMTMAGLLRSL